ncbi:hypothetical protein LOTGIDRAFT_155271 [Lottia gigantea]|uniref:Uncharacterized protein n=1 Tax=Lottia gigantea TaxID=225164 RepID=V3ZID0_LOTGI|nr:hypothetical protein LOTGIDRAFT_155271 [Lottia gigantea]ESO83962.1 hypothetical protein LOTGIDRAFT_155271 [Lottia gigantea]
MSKRQTLQILDFDEVSPQPKMYEASEMKRNLTRDFDLPWFIKNSEESITADDSVSQVIENQTRLDIVTIQTKIDQCKERQEIEMAKLKIQKQEELLALKMELALANAKLDIESECGSHISQSNFASRFQKSKPKENRPKNTTSRAD